jgi:ABC-type nickel/cobalt efflux system permease component RcnA
MSIATIATIVALAVLGYSGYVLHRIYRSVCFTRKQKRMQILITIMVPLIGAWFIHAIYRSDEEIPLKEDKDFILQEHGPG